MKHDKRYEGEYPEIIQAEAKGGVIVEYIRVDVVIVREEKLIKAAFDSGLHFGADDVSPSDPYKDAGIEELK